MPELAEVEYYRKEWDPGLGDTFSKIETHPKARIYRDIPARTVSRALEDTQLVASYTHGKQMLFQFSEDYWLGVHLGMTGKLSSEAHDYSTEKHDHLILRGKKVTLRFCDPRMFGKVTFDQSNNFPDWWQALPPSVLDKSFSKTYFTTFVKRFSKTPIKTVLLDQRGFPGIGNWMADEICWRIQTDPATPCGKLSDEQLANAWKACREVSRKALTIIGDGWDTPPKSWLFTHRWKDGGNCPRKGCGTALLRADLRGRTTCWCPKCQC